MIMEYNRDLILSNNDELLNKLMLIPQDIIAEIVKEVSKRVVSFADLKAELIDELMNVKASLDIDGENIKCFFAINKNGTNIIWESIVNKHSDIFGVERLPLYENVLEYIDEVIDSVDFNDLFQEELNQIREVA